MNAIDFKLNYFVSRLERVRGLEKTLKEKANNEASTVAELKKAEADFRTEDGSLMQELHDWFKEHELPDSFHLVEAIQYFRKKKAIETLD